MIKFLAAAGLVAVVSAPAFAQSTPMDRPIQMNGMETVCTGIGESKDDTRWPSYPIRIEFSNGGAQYLSGATVKVSSGGTQVFEMDCPGAWVLLKGPAGNYRVNALIDDSTAKPVTAAFTIGNRQQKRIILRFPDYKSNE